MRKMNLFKTESEEFEQKCVITQEIKYDNDFV